jgi:cytohesin
MRFLRRKGKGMNIHSATERGNLKAVQEILDGDPAQVNAKDSLGNQPLHIAAWQRRTKVAELLLEKGADINARGDMGRTPLHYAVENNAKSIINLLLSHGADSSIKDDIGVIPLYFAASTGDKGITNLLLRHGATKDLNSSMYIDGSGAVLAQLKADPKILAKLEHPEGLLSDSIRLQAPDLVQFLFDLKPDDSLVEQIQVQARDLVEFLLDHGVDPNAKFGGLFLLHHAISHRAPMIVRLLLEHGADVGIKDHVGGPLLKFCETYGAGPEIAQMLKQAGVSE